MIAFVSIAAAMVAAALAWVLVPLLRRSSRAGVEREVSNLAILRDQRRELDADLASGVLSPERHAQALQELERTVIDEAIPAKKHDATPSMAGTWAAVVLAAGIPILAMGIYVALGSHDAFAPPAAQSAAKAGEHDITPAQVEAMAAKLAAKLEQDPGNAQGWVMLARTYYALQRYPDAVRAYDRAIALVPDDASLLADYADALGSSQGGTLAGKPQELINRALKIDPNQWKALALAGTAAFDAKDYRKAVGYWERTKVNVPPDSEVGKSIDSSIAEARQLAGMPAVDSAKSVASTANALAPLAAPAPAPFAATASASGVAVAGTVRLAPALAAQASPADTVFVFARAAQGPKMPLAILRKQVKDLPYTFTLDDSMAMAPSMSLSKFPEVVVSARVSKSGNAVPQSGDLEGLSGPVKPGAIGVTVTIDRALP